MKHKVTIEFEEVASAIGCGLRQQWIEGESDKAEIDLSCGAGVGTPWLIFRRTESGKSRYLVADIRKLIPELDKLL